MQHLVDQQGLADKIRVDSAGTAGYHIGKLADPRMRAAAEKRGLDLTSRSRIAVPADLKQFDLIIAMDRSNYRDLMGLSQGAMPNNIKLLSDYLSDSWPREVPDPYRGGEEGFEYVLDMLQAACPVILQDMLKQE
jgi:protein-tyrosine phosphatase